MKRRIGLGMAWAAAGILWVTGAGGAGWPDGYPVDGGAGFHALDPSDPGRPEWLFSTARGLARSADGRREWVVYEFRVDRRVAFHHLLMDVRLGAVPEELFVRLLDGSRGVVAEDLFGNVAEQVEGPGQVVMDVPLAEHPSAEVVQMLVSREGGEAAVESAMLTPAAYEILMKTAGDFADGARAWVRPPVYDAKNLGLLSDVVVLEEGGKDDLSTPEASFRAYGVDARSLEWMEAAGGGGGGGASFEVEAMPMLARFDAMAKDMDPLAPPELWVNGVRLGPLSLGLPDLEDPAYSAGAAGGNGRMGRWTRAWYFVPPEALVRGANRLEVRGAGGRLEAGAGWQLREVSLQLKYPWEEIGTYSFVEARASTRDEPVAGETSPAPPETVVQEEDIVVIRVDSGQFRPIGPETPKPGWLEAVAMEYPIPGWKDRQYRIRLNPDNRPAQLGIDIVCVGGVHAPVTVSLLAGEQVVAPEVLRANLDSGYIQMTTSLLVPLEEHPEADTVLLAIGSWGNGRIHPVVARLQLKPGWPTAVLAMGQTGTEGSLLDRQYDRRSAYLPAEVMLPGRDGEPVRARQAPLAVEGEWYGAETRVLHEGEIHHGDSLDTYFTTWDVEMGEAPGLGRVDLMVMHISVVDGLELFVNGERAGAFSLHLPGVHDANYVVFHVNRISEDGARLTTEERYAVDYGAYARASIVFDGRLLRAGRNTIRIGRTPRLKGTNDHYSFKAIRLQWRSARR